ncbi:hypothetical protein ACHAWF_012605 [Thalassiosira exigua]
MAEHAVAPVLAFVAKVLDDDPKIFRAEVDVEGNESDAAAVSIGTLALTSFDGLHRPGSSASPAMGAASSLLNSLCVRLSPFYDARAGGAESDDPASSERVRSLLARAAARACAVLAPTSSGESTASTSDGTRASTVQVDVRDRCYGALCALSRSRFALDDRYALFNRGETAERPSLATIATAELLFGCASNEAEVLRPRATSALDALLGAYVRVVDSLVDRARAIEEEQASVAIPAASNPWANPSENAKPSDRGTKANPYIGTGGLAASLLSLLWNASRRSRSKSSRLAAARWSSELLVRLDNSNAFHLLAFLSGDDDATVSMIAKQALGVEKTLGEDMS